MFFFEDLYFDQIVADAFETVCIHKMLVDGYIELSEYISANTLKEVYRTKLNEMNSAYSFLYANAYPEKDDAYQFWVDNTNGIFDDYQGAVSLKSAECEAIVFWIYKIQKNTEERISFTKEYFKRTKSLYGIDNEIKFANGIFYNSSKIELHVITSLSRFNKEINLLKSSDDTIFYRGHSDINYVMQPSIMRNDKWLEHEHNMYNEIIIECPDSFEKCNTHLEKLVEMQHYGLPTRLLDITRNPLVALYFACCASPTKCGEVVFISSKDCIIKYPQSDCASIIASLPVFSYQNKEDFREMALEPLSKKEFNKKADRLVKEIRTEKPGFSATIDKEDLLNSYIVLAVKNNRRIVNQDGAFILCGLLDRKELLNKYRLMMNGKKVVFVIDKKHKKDILEDLKQCSIHYATLFPEIECVADYVKKKYS